MLRIAFETKEKFEAILWSIWMARNQSLARLYDVPSESNDKKAMLDELTTEANEQSLLSSSNMAAMTSHTNDLWHFFVT